MSDANVVCLPVEAKIFDMNSSRLVHKCDAKEGDRLNNSLLKWGLITIVFVRGESALQDTCLILC